MSGFKVEGRERQDEREVILRFLGSVDAGRLKKESLDDLGWGGGDPIELALEKLKDWADQW